jgi:hypothetical protein
VATAAQIRGSVVVLGSPRAGLPDSTAWPVTKWPWFGELAERGYLVTAVHRGKNLVVSGEIARLLDPICRAEIERMRAADRGWRRLLDHLAAAGPSTVEDLRLELGLKRQELRSLRAPLERCGAVVSRSLQVTAGEGHLHSSELARWDQVYPAAGGTDGGSQPCTKHLIVAGVRAAVVAPELKLRRRSLTSRKTAVSRLPTWSLWIASAVSRRTTHPATRRIASPACRAYPSASSHPPPRRGRTRGIAPAIKCPRRWPLTRPNRSPAGTQTSCACAAARCPPTRHRSPGHNMRRRDGEGVEEAWKTRAFGQSLRKLRRFRQLAGYSRKRGRAALRGGGRPRRVHRRGHVRGSRWFLRPLTGALGCGGDGDGYVSG